MLVKLPPPEHDVRSQSIEPRQQFDVPAVLWRPKRAAKASPCLLGRATSCYRLLNMRSQFLVYLAVQSPLAEEIYKPPHPRHVHSPYASLRTRCTAPMTAVQRASSLASCLRPRAVNSYTRARRPVSLVIHVARMKPASSIRS